MTLLTETRERFLRIIVGQVPVERIAEIHFFQPIKQGGTESGVAVVAAWPEPQPVLQPVDESVAPDSIESVDATEEALIEGSTTDAVSDDASVEADVSDVPTPEASSELLDSEAPEEDVFEPDVAVSTAPRGEVRHTIYTAIYRLTLKGPDRGKWESNVVAEADAPLVTVDAVVRGVQRRSGDVDDATRLEGDEVRALIHALRIPKPGAA